MTDKHAVALPVEWMRIDLARFIAGEMSIDALSSRLKAHIAELEARGQDRDWVDHLRTLRNDLEYVNAVWLESGRPHLSPEERLAAISLANEFSVALGGAEN